MGFEPTTTKLVNEHSTGPVLLHDWVFVYKLSSYGFEFRSCRLNYIYCACFKQGVPWHSGNYRMYTLSEFNTEHDNNIQLGCKLFRKTFSSSFLWNLLRRKLNGVAVLLLPYYSLIPQI